MKAQCPKCNSYNWSHEFPDIGVCKDCGYRWDLTGFPIGPQNLKDIYDRWLNGKRESRV